MRQIACKGFQHGEQAMTPDECQMVCEYLIAESQTKLAHLDLRLLDNAFRITYCGKRVIPTHTGWFSLRPDWTVGRKNRLSRPKIAYRTMIFAPCKPSLTQCPTTLAAQMTWCRLRNKSRASFFRYKRVLESVCRDTR